MKDLSMRKKDTQHGTSRAYNRNDTHLFFRTIVTNK